MNLIKSTPGFETITSVEYQPTISIVMPFSPVTTIKEDLESRINFITGRVESMLIKDHVAQKAMPMIHKLKTVFKNLNYFTLKKSVAIFVSPVIERIIYLDIEMEEHVSVDPAFKISDLANFRKDRKEYLVLLLSDNFSKMYLGKANELKLIKSNALVDAHNSPVDLTLGRSIASFPGIQTGVKMEKFLAQMDVGLSIMLRSYPLPVFALGTPDLLEQFKTITRNGAFIVEYIQGNYDVTSGCDLLFVVRNYLSNWKQIKDRFLMNQIEGGELRGKLSYGLKDVWNAALRQNARLLVLERNCSSTLKIDEIPGGTFNKKGNMKGIFYIKDDVDQLVDRVYNSGGDVFIVDKGSLTKYDQIALVHAG